MTEARAALAALAERRELPPAAVDRLDALLALLAADPTAPTTVRDPRRAAEVHIADALVALELPAVRAAEAIADLGSGAGFPGLPLAIALPGAAVALVESVGRKRAFLARAISATDARNARVVAGRAESWGEGIGGQDVVTARALAPLAVVAEYAAPLLRMGGALVAWKGAVEAEEERAAAAAAAILGLELAERRAVRPYATARRHSLHVYVKVRPTPERFPRRPGMARKRPLGANPQA